MTALVVINWIFSFQLIPDLVILVSQSWLKYYIGEYCSCTDRWVGGISVVITTYYVQCHEKAPSSRFFFFFFFKMIILDKDNLSEHKMEMITARQIT